MNQPNLFNGETFAQAIGEPPSQRHSETSQAAAEAIKPEVTKLHQRLIAFLERQGEDGATDEQMQEGCLMAQNTQRPRRTELSKKGLIVKADFTRKTKSGRSAQVWRLAR